MDKLDYSLVALLQKDGRMAYKTIGETLGYSETTVRNRVNRLVQNEVVQIVAVGDPAKMGFPVYGTMKIKINAQMAENVKANIVNIPELWYIAITTGATDMDVEFACKSMNELEMLIFEKIYKITGVISVETSLILKYIKRSYDWLSDNTETIC